MHSWKKFNRFDWLNRATDDLDLWLKDTLEKSKNFRPLMQKQDRGIIHRWKQCSLCLAGFSCMLVLG